MINFIDGGYLSWSYGVNTDRHSYWTANKALYSWARTRSLFVMDGIDGGHRVEFDDTYKLRRRTKKLEDPEWLLRTHSVIKFRNEVLYPDEDLAFIQVNGYEADDILAVLAHRGPTAGNTLITGVDKDLLQLGSRVTMSRLDGSRVTIPDFCRRLPQGLGRHLTTAKHVLLTLAIFGDKSDGVPRLLPPRQLGILADLYTTKKPFTRAYEIFGESFIHNLYLVALPGPWCFDPVPSPMELYDLIRSGQYPGSLKLTGEIQAVIEVLSDVIARPAGLQDLAIKVRIGTI